MSDRWENRQAEIVRRSKLAVEAYRKTTPTGRPLPNQHWVLGGDVGEVDQPLDPNLFGLGILYAIEADEEGRIIAVRADSDYLSVMALELVDDPRHTFNGHWYDYFKSDIRVPLPAPFASYGDDHREAEVSHPGGGTRNPHKVGIAGRVLVMAAFLAEHLDAQRKADGVKQALGTVLNPEAKDESREDVALDPAPITPERFLTLTNGAWVVAEMEPKNGRKRTIRGDLVEVNGWPNAVYARGDRAIPDTIRYVQIKDKAGRYQVADIPLIKRLITGGEDGITLVTDGELAPDYRLARGAAR